MEGERGGAADASQRCRYVGGEAGDRDGHATGGELGGRRAAWGVAEVMGRAIGGEYDELRVVDEETRGRGGLVCGLVPAGL